MTVKLLTEHHSESLSLKGGCTGSSESIHVKVPSHVATHIMIIEVTSKTGTFRFPGLIP